MNERDFVLDGEHCTCTPGSAENGWHEQRCHDCNAAERRVWGHVIAWTRQHLSRQASDEETQ